MSCFSVTYDTRLLADNIAEKFPYEHVSKICKNENFYNNPINHLIRAMIDRGVGRAREGDGERANVISMIPDFVDKLTSEKYLKEFSVQYFKNHPESEKIQDVFDENIENDEWKKQLASGVEKYKKEKFYDAEDEFRIALTIFPQSEQLKTYTYPRRAELERCSETML
ncbi:MAG: hypothetical protein AAGG81_01435 [Chlamydiota bacterium]